MIRLPCTGNNRAGFTLVELVVVLAIAGLMVGFLLKMLQTKPSIDCYEQTRIEMADIQVAIENFVRDNNRYPKPSNTTFGSSNPAFGTEASSGVTSTGGVLIGSLPTTTLGISTNYADDCWGSKYTYAVTSVLTTAAGFSGSALGAITVKNGPLTGPTVTTAQAAYVVVSNGADKDGATPMSSSTVTANSCTVTPSKTDTQNCDVGAGANSVFATADFNDGAGATNFYDDLIVFADKAGTVAVQCPASTVMWMSNCGITLPVQPLGTVLAAQASTSPPSVTGYSGTATVTCNSDGTYSTSAASCALSACGSGCSYTNPRSGMGDCLTDGNYVEYGSGICATYSCCSGTVQITPIAGPCPLADSVGSASCSAPVYDCPAGDVEGSGHNGGCTSAPDANAGGTVGIDCQDSYASGTCYRSYSYSCTSGGWVNMGMSGQSGNCE